MWGKIWTGVVNTVTGIFGLGKKAGETVVITPPKKTWADYIPVAVLGAAVLLLVSRR